MKECMPIDNEGMPSVSIIVLTYGNFFGLDRTIESILLQDYPIKKIILSDDGSGCLFPERFLEKIYSAFPNITVRQGTENLGTVAHINATVALTETEWIKFLSPGDAFSDSGALRALVSFARKSDAVVAISQAKVCDTTLKHELYCFPGRRGKIFYQDSQQIFQELSKSNLVSATSTIINRRFFTEFGGFDSKYRLLEDWPAWLRLTRNGQALPMLNRVTCFYGMGGVSSRHLDAFESSELRMDMLKCYENEILPYLSQFDSKTCKYIHYEYDRLRGVIPEELLMRYGYVERITRWKQKIKQHLINM